MDEPASDEDVALLDENARSAIDCHAVMNEVNPYDIAAILARLRKAEADNANLTKLLSGYHQICTEAGISPATSEIYAAAERAGGKDE